MIELKEYILKNYPEAIEASDNEIRFNAVDEDDDNLHASVYLENDFYENHRSGVRGNVYRIFGEYHEPQLSNKQMWHIVHWGNIKSIENKPKKIDDKKLRIPVNDIYSFKNALENEEPHEARDFLLNRGLKKKSISKLGFILNGYYEWRIFIPFIENGKIVSFVTRDFSGKKKQKYLNAKNGKISQYVFNYDLISPKKKSIYF